MAIESEPQSLSSLLRDTLTKFSEAVHDEELQFLEPQTKTATGLWATLASMRNIVQHAWARKSDDTAQLLHVLASASRDQRLRPLFGGCFDQNLDPEGSILAYVFDHILPEHKNLDDPGVLENALRLVSNCVADTNCNRKLALQKNAIKDLLRLAKESRSVDFIVPALYNLCVEYDDPGQAIDRGASTAARANPAQIELAHSDPDNGVVQALFDMSNSISPEADQREPLLAGLIEMVSLTAPEDLLCVGISHEMDSQARRRAAYQIILTFLGVCSVPLISHDGDAAVSVCNAFLCLLAAPEIKQVLVLERQLQSLVSFYHTISTHRQELLGNDDENETLASLQQCEKALLQEFYILSGLPEFTAAYTLDIGGPGWDFINVCIERPRDARFWTYSPIPTDPSIAIAYTVLANITTSEETAIMLIHTYHVHEPLQAILRDLDDADTIYPALGLLSRLSLPSANKQEIANCGMLDVVRRFLSGPREQYPIDWKPALRIEALTMLRRLISGQVGILTYLHEDSDLGSYIRDILDFFTTCKNSATKVEIGRLCVEHFRTISATQDHLDPRPKLSEQILNQDNLAEPIAFLACEGQSPGAKAEGWFGLGLMTFWSKTRAQVFELMKSPRMVEEVGKVADAVASADRASADNLKLVLSKLDLDQSTTDMDRHTREVFASAKQKLGLQHAMA